MDCTMFGYEKVENCSFLLIDKTANVCLTGKIINWQLHDHAVHRTKVTKCKKINWIPYILHNVIKKNNGHEKKIW